MKRTKRIISVMLAVMLLCASPTVLAAPAKSNIADGSTYPTIILGGGWHKLVYEEPGLEGQTAFDSQDLGDLFAPLLDEALSALTAFDVDGLVDVAKNALWDMLGPIRMDENGESVANIVDGIDNYENDNVYSNTIWCYLDWRLDPMENAESLHEFIVYLQEERGVDKFHLKGMSASGPILLAYLKLYGYDSAASIVFDISMHNGTTLFGGMAKRQITLDTEALGKLSIPTIGDVGIPSLQPWLHILYETGLIDFIDMFLAMKAQPFFDRIYDEILIPLIFMMPVFWSYVPTEDYEEAKEALLQGDPKYANLVTKLDRYHNDVQLHADEIILSAAEHVKVGVRASYGIPLLPIVQGAAVQADLLLDTVHASMGATCAPLETPFGPWYRQKVKDGHDHISPDRLIDASTCLLPEQTWFNYKRPHKSDSNYSGWYDWFKRTDNPTVFDNEAYPQFVEESEPYVFVPMEREQPTLFESVLKTIGLHLLKIWRWLLLMPLNWIVG